MGIALHLIECGYRVSYAVTSSFAPLIRSIGAEPVVVEPLDIRGRIISASAAAGNSVEDRTKVRRFALDLINQRTAGLLSQLEGLYGSARPDLVIHDDSLDMAGRELASKWNIARMRHHSQFIDKEMDEHFLDFSRDNAVLLTVPNLPARRGITR